MATDNKQKANKLSESILNYFAAFTETGFNFRTLINYRWTNNEHILTLSSDDILLGINEAISGKFGLVYLKTCIKQKFNKKAELNKKLLATEIG
jgi:hypothetical protein